MTSGIGAAVGAYRAVLLCMAAAFAYGLHAGWVQPLFTGVNPDLWVARPAALWAVLAAAFWPTARSCADRVAMSLCMLMISGLICLAAAYGIIGMTTAAAAM